MLSLWKHYPGYTLPVGRPYHTPLPTPTGLGIGMSAVGRTRDCRAQSSRVARSPQSSAEHLRPSHSWVYCLQISSNLMPLVCVFWVNRGSITFIQRKKRKLLAHCSECTLITKGRRTVCIYEVWITHFYFRYRANVVCKILIIRSTESSFPLKPAWFSLEIHTVWRQGSLYRGFLGYKEQPLMLAR